jgi:SAM-dependent methyltransferase
LLPSDDLRGQRFLDVGCGSGLFSLAARSLGADVVSIDVDRESLTCTERLKAKFHPNDEGWLIEYATLLDGDLSRRLGTFDWAYCWGVAHHTGNLWRALENLIPLVKPEGRMVLAVYNDQLYITKLWRLVKLIYQKLPRLFKPIWAATIGLLLFYKRLTVTVLVSLFRIGTLQNPLVPWQNWLQESRSRGMNGWYDLVDWVGGWPFEVARPEEVFRFFRDRNFELRELTTSSGHGCNEFVFTRKAEKTQRGLVPVLHFLGGKSV